jgi:hypothetical protein
MTVANCKTICREIEEADQGDNVTASVMEHLAGCRQCQRFYDERRKLRQLVASLETVAAPPDFDLRVRSRIANERVDARGGFLFSNLSFGFPSIALAALVLVIGGVFALRVWNAPANNATVFQTETRDVIPANMKSEPSPLAGKSLLISELTSTETKGTADATGDEGNETPRPSQLVANRRSLKRTVASVRSNRRLATKEFSSTPAPVVKQEEAIASLEPFPIFPIETSSQPLRLSLDYATGVSRTISVPTLSFGSERALTGGGSMVKTSAKGAW